MCLAADTLAAAFWVLLAALYILQKLPYSERVATVHDDMSTLGAYSLETTRTK